VLNHSSVMMYDLLYALKPSRILSAQDYVDLATGTKKTFIERYKQQLDKAGFDSANGDNLTRFFLTKAMGINNCIFLPDGGVVFHHEGRCWYASSTPCGDHANLTPCFYCATDCLPFHVPMTQ
jgi:hypothetical protein